MSTASRPKAVAVRQSYQFDVPGNPEAWQVQVRRARRSPAYERRVAWQEQIRAAARMYWQGSPLEGLVYLRLEFYRAWPSWAPQRHGKAAARWIDTHLGKKPDLTNYQKAAEDALSGVIFVDDSQVMGVTATKDYADADGYTTVWFEIL